MARIFSIAKHLPAVLSGLLVVAWVVSLNQEPGIRVRWRNSTGRVSAIEGSALRGCLNVSFNSDDANEPGIVMFVDPYSEIRATAVYAIPWAGELSGNYLWSEWIIAYGFLPISLLLTLLLPFSLGALLRFRFSLWSYFAFTALVAVELAYYLRG